MRLFELQSSNLPNPGPQDLHFQELESSEDNNLIAITASSQGQELGRAVFWRDGNELTAQMTQVRPQFQRQGIAAKIYDHAKHLGYTVRRSWEQTPAGRQFWEKNRPGQGVWEQQNQPQQARARNFIKKIYNKFPASPTNPRQRIMSWSQGDDMDFVIFELEPSVFKDNAVEINWIQSYPQGAGVGTKAIQALQNFAAQDNISLTLYPWDKGRMSQTKLTNFYKSRGFEPVSTDDKNLIWHPNPTQSTVENFADGKKPGRRGLSAQVGIPKKASLAQLEKIAKTSTGERERMAQWQLNMRRGKNKNETSN